MNQEKRVLLASILSAFALVYYANYLRRFEKPATTPQSLQVAPEKSPSIRADKDVQLLLSEEVIYLDSSTIRLEIGKKSAAIHAITLKNFDNVATRNPMKFGGAYPSLQVQIEEPNGTSPKQFPWELLSNQASTASWAIREHGEIVRQLSVSLDDSLPTFRVELHVKNLLEAKQPIPLNIVASWSRADAMSGRYNALEAVVLTEKQSPWQRSHLHYLEGLREAKIVPRGTSLVTLSERFFCQSIRPDPRNRPTTALLPSERGTISAQLQASLIAEKGKDENYAFSVYVGPRDFFKLREAGFEQAFPVGFLAKIGLILVWVLRGIASLVKNYGVAIILLGALVTTLLSPFTILSFRSMKKLQELQPKMDQLKKKYAHDPKRLNQETFALFKEQRVSPMGGCLPMLLQLPIFFALWSAISHVIEFRGERFLWIQDLSLPDRLAKLPGSFELNLLPILMAGAMYVQSKLSQVKTARPALADSPTTNPFSGPMMSIIFGVMFYQVPAGLVLYWLTNSVVSIAWYRVARI